MNDFYYQVLSTAFREYDIEAPWENYALHIIHGDGERCLELYEKPVVVYKQLYKEGKRPLFMFLKRTVSLDTTGTELPSTGFSYS